MAPVVVDSGILAASVLDESISENANALLTYWHTQDLQLAAPLLFHYEIVAITRKAVSQKRIQPERGSTILDYLLTYPVSFHLDQHLLRRGFDLAAELNRPTAYDSQYLAVAERLDCEFWTADKRLYNAVHEQLDWVKWVGNFEPAE